MFICQIYIWYFEFCICVIAFCSILETLVLDSPYFVLMNITEFSFCEFIGSLNDLKCYLYVVLMISNAYVNRLWKWVILESFIKSTVYKNQILGVVD
jgi:hypothetical protein